MHPPRHQWMEPFFELKSHHNPTIKSYVLRQGRLTNRQKAAITTLWDQYGLTFEAETILPEQLYANNQPLYLEIGFGNGESLWQMASEYVHCNFLGIEVHQPGVGRLLARLAQSNIHNIKIICHDAVDVIQQLPPQSLTGVHIFFPDPWPKKKHHKRRLIQPWFVHLLVEKLQNNGYIHLATDWQDYAQHMVSVMAQTQLINLSLKNRDKPKYRPITKFEQRGHQLGHEISDLIYGLSMAPMFPSNLT